MKPDLIDRLFAQYYNDALLYTLSLCHDRTEAEDIVSTAFYKALLSPDEEIRSFKPWLLAVCRNEYVSLCRRKKPLALEELTAEPAEESRMLEQIIQREEYRALYRALELLKEPQREVILLFYFSSLPVRDIAAVTGHSESGVKVLLFRGREKLKQLMEEDV